QEREPVRLAARREELVDVLARNGVHDLPADLGERRELGGPREDLRLDGVAAEDRPERDRHLTPRRRLHAAAYELRIELAHDAGVDLVDGARAVPRDEEAPDGLRVAMQGRGL